MSTPGGAIRRAFHFGTPVALPTSLGMVVPILLAFVSMGSFLGLAYAAVSTPRTPFQRMTLAMAVVAAGLLLVSPGAGAALLGPVVLSRRLANAAVPDTVAELLAIA